MKRIVVMVLGLMLALTFIGFANAGVLYEEYFDGGNLDDWTQIPDSENFLVGNWSIQEGVLECEFDPATGPHGSYLRLDAPTLPDSHSVEFDSRMVIPQAHPSSSAIGVKTNFSGWDNYVGLCGTRLQTEPAIAEL
jgi:hypothetical protein